MENAPVAAAPRYVLAEKILIGLSVAGIGFMSYLVKLHFQPAGAGSFCDFGAGLSCETVNKSLYSEVLGVPLSILGLLYFAGIAVLVWAKPVAWWRQAIAAFTSFSLLFGLNLTLIEVRVLGSMCLFCEGSKLLMLGILATVEVSSRKAGASIRWPWYVGGAGVGQAFAMVTRYLQENFY